MVEGKYHASIKHLQTKLFINGEFVDAIDGKTFDTINPANEEVITKVAEASEADVNKAIAAARAAFDKGTWRRISPRDRGILMYKLCDLLEANKEELAHLETLDSGKPYNFTSVADIPLFINVLRYYAGWCDKIQGMNVPMNGPF